jgi:hypothetical protein
MYTHNIYKASVSPGSVQQIMPYVGVTSDLRMDYLYSLEGDSQNTAPVVKTMCLLARYLVMDICESHGKHRFC